VDFKNAVVIMTSNLGSTIIQECFANGQPSAQATRDMETRVRAELHAHFRPEFLNRVDDTILFHSLDESQIAAIVTIQLARLEKRLKAQHLELVVEDAAKALLAREGFDPQFGARPLKRAIQEHLLDPMASRLLEGKIKPGETIRVTAGKSGLQFEPNDPAMA
jgi:ATP-dependent Clp protease ATP-binding subunit ClpA